MIVIFATNLVDNYDKAFETRVRHKHFTKPNYKARREFWRKHLPIELPQKQDVSIEELAKIEDICGRDVKNAVIDSAVRIARSGKQFLELDDLIEAIERIKNSRITSQPSNSQKLTPEELAEVRDKLVAAQQVK